MASTQFEFDNDAGRRLRGVIETGDKPPHAYALFAHCFTCSKASHAAVRVSRGLASRGIATLRFDFTGLGDSEGEFGDGLSGDRRDVAAAARAMAAAGKPVSLLIGHSFGGAAAIAAAGDIATVRAVATIGAPAHADHVLGQLDVDLAALAGDEPVEVTIGGRPFKLGADFAREMQSHDFRHHIAGLGRALLVLHSPIDQVVGIDSASDIFLPAKHPKSFVSLDKADHFLSRASDADYAAAVIATWAAPFIAAPEAMAPVTPPPGVRAVETGVGKFQVEVSAGGLCFLADEPVDAGGLGSGPGPFDLLSAGLGACTAMTCRLYATQKGWPLDRVIVRVNHTAKTATAKDCFTRELTFEGDLDDGQRQRLLEIADKCPVHRTLTAGSDVETHTASMVPMPVHDGDGGHFDEMMKNCKDAG